MFYQKVIKNNLLYNYSFDKKLNKNHITFKRSPFPCKSVNDETLPPDTPDIVTACPTLGLSVLAPTAIPMHEPAKLTAGSRKLFHGLSVPSKIFFNLFLNHEPSNLY